VFTEKAETELPEHYVKTVPEVGWAGKQNGDLLRAAEADFDVLLTNDQNIEHQQYLNRFDLAFVVLVAVTNDIDDLRPLMPAVNTILSGLAPGEIVYIR